MNKEKKTIFDNFQKILIRKILILIMITFIGLTGIFFLAQKIKKQVNYIQDLQKQISDLINLSETFSRLSKESLIALPYLEYVKNLLPEKPRLINFSKDLGELAKKHNLEYGLALQEETAIKNQLSFVMTLKGNFLDFIEFLKELKKFPYYVSLDSFDISGGTPEEVASGIKIFSANIKGRVFVRE